MKAVTKKNENTKRKKSVSRMVEDVVGCKWTLSVLGLVRKGIIRPGAMEKSVEGLTTKVLNERLRKLVKYEILQRHAYPEIPPKVEYKLTLFGKKFMKVLDAIDQLEKEIGENN